MPEKPPTPDDCVPFSLRPPVERALVKWQQDFWKAEASDKPVKSNKKKDELPPLTNPTDEKGRELKERKFADAKITYAKFSDGKFRPVEILGKDKSRTIFEYNDDGTLKSYTRRTGDGGLAYAAVKLDEKHEKVTLSDAGVLEIVNIYTGAKMVLGRDGERTYSLGPSGLRPDELVKAVKTKNPKLALLLAAAVSGAWSVDSREKALNLAEDLSTVAQALQKGGYKEYAEEIRNYAGQLALDHRKIQH
jgi:hypothetical protein